MAQHPALSSGGVAVVTGAAGGIGLALARRFAQSGLKVVVADLPGEALAAAERSVAEASPAGAAAVRSQPTDVSRIEDLRALKATADALGPVTVLVNNAGVGGGGKPWENYDAWKRLIDINLWGVINGVQTFVPEMIARAQPGLVINTGSKQGITTPPGDAAYNVTKAGVKVVTEQLAHELRQAGAPISAHLLIPGYTFTGMTARGATEKPAGAWSADQVVDFMLKGLEAGDFYILCPDNDVARPVDEKRMRWAMDDIVLNRPALSRWHPDYADAFAAYMAQEN